MADRVRKVSYCYVVTPNRSGQGAEVFGEIGEEGVGLLAHVGFPIGGGRAQLDFVTDDIARLRRAARRNRWRLSKVKKAFLIQGSDKTGAVYRHLRRLADAGVSVTAAAGVAAGKGRYGLVLWVKPKAFSRAARALGAR